MIEFTIHYKIREELTGSPSHVELFRFKCAASRDGRKKKKRQWRNEWVTRVGQLTALGGSLKEAVTAEHSFFISHAASLQCYK